MIDDDVDEPQGSPPWTVLAGLIMVLGVGWWLLSAPRPRDVSVPTTTAPSTSVPSATVPTTVPGRPGTTAPRRVSPDNPYHVSVPRLEVGGPVMVGRTGELFVGDLERPVRRVDLATGSVEVYELAGAPLGEVAGRLVVVADEFPASSLLIVVDVADPDGSTPLIVPVPGVPKALEPAGTDGAAWVAVESRGRVGWVYIDLATGLVGGPAADDSPPGPGRLSPDGRFRVERGESDELRVFRAADGVEVLVRYFLYSEPAFSPDGDLLVTVGNGVHLFDLVSGEWAAFDLDPSVVTGRAVFVTAGIG